MPERSQESRLIRIKTTLGEDVLLLTAMSGYEALSEPFNFQLELASEKDDIAATDIVGKAVDIELTGNDDQPRFFNGHVSHFAAGELRTDGYRAYQAEIVPWLWFLGYSNNCRIFQNQTAVEIIEAVLKEKEVSDFKKSLTGTYVKRDYCVQFNETDFDFISRLLEEEGIFYFFEHIKGKHTLVLADNMSAYKKCAESSAEYLAGHVMENQLSAWSNQYSYISGKFTQNDFNFEAPSNDLKCTSSSVIKLVKSSNFEHYAYPGNFLDKKAGSSRTTVRMEEEEALYHVVSSAGTYRSFFAGGMFTIKDHVYEAEKNKSYVITKIYHQANDDSYTTGGGSSDYQNQFSCIPSNVVFRPGLRHFKPAVHGPQTAVVVGPKGEEIYTDKYGRVKVQFHWDRQGKSDEKSSCWVRVAQTMVGKKWGAIFIPRIGQEVVVSFIDGDLDRPLITGCVYNAEFMPPYDLPANKTQSGIKTRSSKDGATATFNELRFEDKKGSEEIYFHAEKNFNRTVENDDSLIIHKNRSKTIKEGNEIVILEKGNREKTLKDGNETITLEKGNLGYTLQKGNHTTALKSGNMDVKLDQGNLSTKASSGTITIEASNGIELKVGGSTIKITPTSIVLKNGSNSVKIDPSGVAAKGTTVKIAGQAMAEVKSPMTTVKGDGILTLKGGVTMIN